MLLLGMSMFMVSCSEGTADRQTDDNQTTGTDDPNGGTDEEDSPIVGTWASTRRYFMYSSGEIGQNIPIAEGEEYWVLDGSEISFIYDGEEQERYPYTFDGKTILFTDAEGYPEEYEVVTVTDTDMTLCAVGEDTWYWDFKKSNGASN